MIFALIDDTKEDREKLHTLLTEYAAYHSVRVRENQPLRVR